MESKTANLILKLVIIDPFSTKDDISKIYRTLQTIPKTNLIPKILEKTLNKKTRKHKKVQPAKKRGRPKGSKNKEKPQLPGHTVVQEPFETMEEFKKRRTEELAEKK